MVMADQESPPTELKQEPRGIPLDEVLGEAEARFGPMPSCLRSILLPPPPKHSLVSTTVSFDTSKSNSESSPNIISGHSPSENDRTRETDPNGHEGGISLDDIALVSSSSPSSLKDSTSFSQEDTIESPPKSDTIFLELDDEYEENARRSPDSGCSMSEASAEDKVSIASTVSASSDDGGTSRLGNQIQRLKQAMRELREQDVALARQLLVVYDYVEETKWFLENFEACDSRHSITGPMSSTERRFSQNFQKRMSDFGMKGVPHSGFATPPSWTELNSSTSSSKRHSRNISDGMISIEQLRRIYHENNNNSATGNVEGMDKSESCEAFPDGSSLDTSVIKHKSRPMTRRSISSNFLEISFSSMTSKGDHGRHQAPLSPISDSAKTVTMNGNSDGDDEDDDMHFQSTQLPSSSSVDQTGEGATTVDDERTRVPQTVSFYVSEEEKQLSADSHTTSDHHRGSASSSSASSMMSMQSCSSTSSTFSTSIDTCTKSNSSQKTAKPINKPPVSSSTSSIDPTADDCSIFIADEDDFIEDNRTPMSPFESHMSWLQEQDETLL